MPRPTCLATLLPAVATILAPCADAFAQGAAPVDDDLPSPFEIHALRAELAGGAGFGERRVATGESLNPFGVCASARLGYTFLFPAYLGLRLDHFFGSFEQYPVPLVAMTTYRVGATFLGASAGIELRPSPAFLRPQLALGALAIRSSASCSPVDGSFADLSTQVCAAHDGSSTSWAPSAVTSLPMGLRFGRFYGFVEPEYFIRKTTSGYAILGGLGVAL